MKTTSIGRRARTILGVIVLVAIVSTQHAEAAIVIDVTESGGNVNAVLDGSANLNALAFETNWGDPSLTADFSSGTWIWVGSGTGNFQEFSGPSLSGPASFGTASAALILADATSGPLAGIIAQTTSGIGLPNGYISGTTISSTSTWFGTTIADMGFVPGTYVWTWGIGGDADSLTLNIVPEPATFALGSLGLLGIVGRRRKHQ
jgi:PEP-CTERM motif-containing protein